MRKVQKFSEEFVSGTGSVRVQEGTRNVYSKFLRDGVNTLCNLYHSAVQYDKFLCVFHMVFTSNHILFCNKQCVTMESIVL
jgi:hypothetical protein